jgi:hypothetical protein
MLCWKWNLWLIVTLFIETIELNAPSLEYHCMLLRLFYFMLCIGKSFIHQIKDHYCNPKSNIAFWSHVCVRICHYQANPNVSVDNSLLTYLIILFLYSYNTSGAPDFTSVLSGVRVARSLVFFVMFCRSLFVLLSSFFIPSCCLSFFNLRILITPLASSNSSYHRDSNKE